MPHPIQSKPIPQKPSPTQMGVGVYCLGSLALLAALAAAGMLAAEHLGWFGSGLPGCGVGSGCDKATNSAFGRLPWSIPGVGKWSVSFVGFAFFVSMLSAWLLVGRAVPRTVVWMARLGLLASLFFIWVIAMHWNEYFCKYCVASHAANLLFWCAAEFGSPRRAPGGIRALATAGMVFIATSVGLGAADRHAQAANAQKQEDTLQQEISAMQAEAARQAADAQKAAQQPAPQAPAPRKRDYPPIDIGIPIPPDGSLKQEGFTGRYRLGPAEAPIRLVIFSDYQCKDCARVEKEVRALVRSKPNISLSAKQWAFDNACNKYMDRAMHPNACWAARAAEAAGILRGNAGFWQMHFWLYDRKTNGQDTPGSFTDAELDAGLVEMGYDPAEFKAVMQGPETLARVQKDFDEAFALGVLFTPLIYVNGREFRGWGAVDGLKRYVEAIEKLNPAPPPLPPTVDKPPAKQQKFVEDWQSSPRVNLARPAPMFGKGPKEAKIRVVMFGDYRDSFTPQMWKTLTDLMAGRDDVAVDFRPRSITENCQVMGMPDEQSPACRMARAVEAAGRLGGPDAFWKMHEWLILAGTNYTEASLPDAAKAAGLDIEALKAEMKKEELLDILIQNTKLLQRSGARGVPALFVNERYVWRWNIDGTSILDRVFAEAAAGR